MLAGICGGMVIKTMSWKHCPLMMIGAGHLRRRRRDARPTPGRTHARPAAYKCQRNFTRSHASRVVSTLILSHSFQRHRRLLCVGLAWTLLMSVLIVRTALAFCTVQPSPPGTLRGTGRRIPAPPPGRRTSAATRELLPAGGVDAVPAAVCAAAAALAPAVWATVWATAAPAEAAEPVLAGHWAVDAATAAHQHAAAAAVAAAWPAVAAARFASWTGRGLHAGDGAAGAAPRAAPPEAVALAAASQPVQQWWWRPHAVAASRSPLQQHLRDPPPAGGVWQGRKEYHGLLKSTARASAAGRQLLQAPHQEMMRPEQARRYCCLPAHGDGLRCPCRCQCILPSGWLESIGTKRLQLAAAMT